MQIQFKEITLEVPESWNDLSLEQQLACYQILMSDSPSPFLSEEVLSLKRIQLMQYLLNLEDDLLHEWEQDCLENYGEEQGKLIFQTELQEVSTQTTAFFFEEIENTEAETPTSQYQLALTLTKMPYPELIFEQALTKAQRKRKKKQKKKKLKLYGPADVLANISLYELATTFTLFENYLETQDEQLILQLLATLYRPHKQRSEENELKGYEGDIRLPYLKHESTVERRIPYLSHLHPLAKALILFWFASCRQQIVNAYPLIFKQPDDSQPATRNDFGWGGVLMQLAGGIIHLDQISSQPYQNGLHYLSFLEAQRKEQEAAALQQALR